MPIIGVRRPLLQKTSRTEALYYRNNQFKILILVPTVYGGTRKKTIRIIYEKFIGKRNQMSHRAVGIFDI